MADRYPRQNDVAEEMAAQLARVPHDPSHAERCADELCVARAGPARADDFLERNDVGADGGEDLRDPVGPCPAVHAAAAMDVVGGVPQVAVAGPVRRVWFHRHVQHTGMAAGRRRLPVTEP